MVDLSELPGSKLEILQGFEPDRLARKEELGRSFDFEAAVEPAREVVQFFQQFPVRFLPQISQEQRHQIEGQAESFLNVLQQILKFDPAQEPNAVSTREQLIEQVRNWKASSFNHLFPIAAYLATRQRDFSAIEREARQAADEARAEAERLRKELSEVEAEAQRILKEVKATASELGVSQQALHFGAEVTAHDTAAGKWQAHTVKIAIGLGAFAVITLALGEWILVPDNAYQAFQLGLSKVLIFATIAFMLFLSARTLMAHRHNSVVNRHRQNALLTFNALVDATHTDEARDIVLTHASACIFSPQDSGFSKVQLPSQTMVEILPKLSSAATQ